MSIPYKPTKKQKLFHASTANEILFGGAAGGGKELDINTLIPTTNGFVRMGDMKSGMKVFGLDGKAYEVTRCSEIHHHEGYAFVFDDGTRIVCNGEHLWFTYTAADLAAMEKTPWIVYGSVKTADEIVATLKTARGKANHVIPVARALELPERELAVEPYLMGVQLGNGAGEHVPADYLWASEGQRLAVLQGLMDTDGSCNLSGSAEFCNMNRQLAEDVAFLVRSLGMKCRVTTGRAKLNGRDCGEKYRVKFTPNRDVFRLERKLKRMKPEHRRTTRMRYLVSAERVEACDMRCIAIDSPDHLYLASESLVATHNTKALIMDALFRTLSAPGTTAVVFRRTYNELEDTDIKEAMNSYPKEVAKYNSARHEFRLINGSHILFRHCEHEADRFNYSGIEIQFLYFDELTSFEQVIYDFLKTRLRAKKSLGVTPIVRSASNPGNIGHGWVKKMFVDAGDYLSLVKQEIYSEALHRTRVSYTQYIPALATENPHITEDYIFELEQKPKALRDALLNGDWDSFEGQVFTEFVNSPEHYKDRIWTHVIEPFPIPIEWPRYMSYDYGYTKPFSVGFWAVDPQGRVYRYKEWYGCRPRQPNTGLCLTCREITAGIIEKMQDEIRDNITVDCIADPAIFDKSRGESVADLMRPTATTRGINFRRGDNTRLPGKMQVHERLRFDAAGRPGMYIFSNCVDWIRTVPNLPYSSIKPEDIDTDAEDHCYDETRYFLMARPVAPTKKRPIEYKGFDPFDRGD